MRKVEQAMIAAIRDGRRWRGSNTNVTPYETIAGLDSIEVHLHSNHIATVRRDTVAVTLAGWNTPTTRSRVNAILRTLCAASVFVSRGVPRIRTIVDSYLIGTSEWITVQRAGVAS